MNRNSQNMLEMSAADDDIAIDLTCGDDTECVCGSWYAVLNNTETIEAFMLNTGRIYGKVSNDGLDEEFNVIDDKIHYNDHIIDVKYVTDNVLADIVGAIVVHKILNCRKRGFSPI